MPHSQKRKNTMTYFPFLRAFLTNSVKSSNEDSKSVVSNNEFTRHITSSLVQDMSEIASNPETIQPMLDPQSLVVYQNVLIVLSVVSVITLISTHFTGFVVFANNGFLKTTLKLAKSAKKQNEAEQSVYVQDKRTLVEMWKEAQNERQEISRAVELVGSRIDTLRIDVGALTTSVGNLAESVSQLVIRVENLIPPMDNQTNLAEALTNVMGETSQTASSGEIFQPTLDELCTASINLHLDS
jgi:hypothetical protein